jgi:hypothetical protein
MKIPADGGAAKTFITPGETGLSGVRFFASQPSGDLHFARATVAAVSRSMSARSSRHAP